MHISPHVSGLRLSSGWFCAYFPPCIRAEAVLRVVEQELPESAALLRLSGMEVTECLSEVSSLGSDLTNGLKSTANMATAVEQVIKAPAV